ncbi:MAG: 3-methyl-2-oxobutanoate hydroxymethyltransferase [Gammaproteobacteria bacterium]|nr:3-methyl-2-oxobutanoate hydroxymethyltransferase [Gammaproteobacteria bacterium]MCW8910574.1 3-methyl-2-oxobutanoate hydroxymethyltransferase [Gammaproteobacteria bacterium]MCW9056470.1 3-methyl-2-oxobutanoate hydroxymethyltransferase [Gammaproteobacteria bacterium]
MSSHNTTGRVTVPKLKEMKAQGEKIACLTAYDASFARLLDNNGVDVVLVGDSLGMVIQGLETTLPVTMDEMVYHGQAVSRGLDHAFLIMDMPFMSDASVEEAVANAGRFMKQAGANMVKLEGGADQKELVATLTRLGIPVCAHLGLQPQRVHKLGGYRVQGREHDVAERMLEDARVLEQAGADMLLLECVPVELAEKITKQSKIPVIGIGAGNICDGQILVLYDILGISVGHIPKFAKNYMAESTDIAAAVNAYVTEVKNSSFPSAEHSF